MTDLYEGPAGIPTYESFQKKWPKRSPGQVWEETQVNMSDRTLAAGIVKFFFFLVSVLRASVGLADSVTL
jgi:hypothetical protein